MTIQKKGTVSTTREKGAAKVAATSSSADVATTETIEVVSSTSVVEESRQVMESETRSSMMEVTSASREVVMDSKGNVIEVIETPARTVGQSSSSRTTGTSSRDFIAGEQAQSVKQAKTMREVPRESVEMLSDGRTTLRGETINGQSMQVQSQSESRTVQQQAISSNTSLETSSSSVERGGHRSSVSKHVSRDTVRNGDQVPVLQTSSKSTESIRMSSETSEAITKDGQTVSSTTRIRETGEKIDDNGKTTSTSSREIDSERTTKPFEAVAERIEDVERTKDKSTRIDSKTERPSAEVTNRCNKPGQSTWDGTFIYEKPATPRGKSTPPESGVGKSTTRDDKGSAVDKAVTFKVHGDARRDGGTSVKVTQESSAEEMSVIDQIISTSTAVTRDSSTTIVDEGRLTTKSGLRTDFTSSDKVTMDTTDFAGERGHVSATERSPKAPPRRSKPGDSAWDGSFVVESSSTETRGRRRDDSDDGVFHRSRGDDVVESTTTRMDLERSADGTYEKETSETVRVAKGAAGSVRFITEERHDASRESSSHADTRTSSPSRRRVVRPGDSAWSGEFVYERAPDNARKRPSDVTVIRRTEKHHDFVDVQDVTEEQSVSSISQGMSASYIVEYAGGSSDRKSVEKVTSVSDAIPEEDAPGEDRSARGPGRPERQPEGDTAGTRCYKPGQSAWDGTFVYERPKTADSRRRPEEKRAVRTVDIREVTDDSLINEADITSTSYIVEHSSSQQSFSDVRDASLSSTICETVIYEGHPVEMTIRVEEDASRSKVSTTDRQGGPSPRPRSPEKIPKDRDLRATKPGSSTWDGTFVMERSQETKRPPSRESTDGRAPDKPRQADGKKPSSFTDTSTKHVSETAIDSRNVETRDISSTSEIAKSSVVMEQSRVHESHTDSSDLDFSTTSVEKVVIRDGQPVTSTRTKTTSVQEGPRGPAKRLPSGDAITAATDVKESTVRTSEKESRADDRSYRPAKPGSSTWDGSFVYEKSREKRPEDKTVPKETEGTADKRSPTRERPNDLIDRGTSVTISKDVSKDVTTSVADYTASSITLEHTLLADSKTHDTTRVSKTFVGKETTEDKIRAVDRDGSGRPRDDERPEPSLRRRPDDGKAARDGSQKSPVDRTHRPTKPGASTWDGSFVYEKPQDSRKRPADGEPTDGEARGPTDEGRKPVGDGRAPTDRGERPSPIPRKSTDDKGPRQNVTIVRYVEDAAEDVARTSEAVQQRSTYVIDQSTSFTSVHDVRDVTDERVIAEFTTDTRKDAVSNCVRPYFFISRPRRGNVAAEAATRATLRR